jgi:transcriptional regulator with XRE-family HTH domain
MAPTPKRKTDSRPGARFMTAAVAKNVHDRRVLKGITQEDLAGRMRDLGHTAWAGPTVSQVERGRRSLSLDEFLGLALTIGVAIPELLDVRGVEGRQSEPVELGHTAPLSGDYVNEWAHGRAVITPSGEGWDIEIIPSDEFDRERLMQLEQEQREYSARLDELVKRTGLEDEMGEQ